VASDGGGRNGLFTQHLLKAIDTPNLKVEDVYKNTADGVYHATNGKQFPTSEGGIVGKFYFSQSDTLTTSVTHNANVYLTVKTSPAQATVRILNIAPKYKAGIPLKTVKKYQIEVSYQGYQTQRGEVSYQQGGEQVLTVILQPSVSGFNQGFIATPATTIAIKQPPTAPVKKMFSGDAAHFHDNQDGTATDTKTGLQWMRCSLGQRWANNSCVGEASKHTWQQALDKARSFSYAGYSNWRVPTIKELNSLVVCSNGKQLQYKNNGFWAIETEGSRWCKSNSRGDYQQPTILQKVFPNTPSNWFWSSSPNANLSNSAWAVLFNGGGDFGFIRNSSSYVRLVR